MSTRQHAQTARFAPDRLSVAARQRLGALLSLLLRFRRRGWWQESAQRAVRSATFVLPVIALSVFAARLALLEQEHDGVWLIGGIVAAVGFAAWTLLHRMPWWEAARRVDQRGSGRDRARTAIEMAMTDRADPWVDVQAVAANRWASQQDVVALLPGRVPAGLGALGLVAAALVLAVALPLEPLLAPTGQPGRSGLALRLPSPPAGFDDAVAIPAVATVDRDLLAADIQLLAEVQKQLPKQSPTKDWLRDLQRTIERVEHGELGQSDALAELARLDKERPGPQTSPDLPEVTPDSAAERSDKAEGETLGQGADKAVRDTVAESLKKSLEAAPVGKEREQLKRAAAEKDLSAISKLIEKIATKDMSDKELEKWIKVAEKFARHLGNQKIPKKFDELAKRVRRLQKKRDDRGGLNAGDRRRLRDVRRSLQQLRRDHGDVDAARHRLQRLERGARHAADEMRRSQASRLARGGARKGPKGAADAAQQRREAGRRVRQQMKQAADELRRESHRQKERHAQRIGQSRMRDLREAMRRSQRSASARRDFEQRARRQRGGTSGQPGRRKQSAGKQGKRGGRMEAAQAGSRKAGEQAARGKAAARGQKPGEGQGRKGGKGTVRLGKGEMDGHSRMRMMQAEAKAASGPPGDGKQPGDQTGGANKGQRPGVRAGRNEKLTGVQSDGPTVKQTFLDAARRGFARRSWRAVYARYSDVAQEMMDREALPPGRRAMVQRYFELIRPQSSSRPSDVPSGEREAEE